MLPFALMVAMHAEAQQILKPDETRSGQAGGLQVGSYTLHARAGQQLYVATESDQFDTMLTVEGPDDFYEENDNQFGYNFGAPRDYKTAIHDSALYLVIPRDGTYQIEVSAREHNERGTYRLVLEELPRLTAGESISGTLIGSDHVSMNNAYVDWYAFRATPGQKVSFRVSSAEFPTLIAIADGDSYYENFGSRDNGFREIEFDFGEGGEFRIGVSSETQGTGGKYLLQTSAGGIAVAAVLPSAEPTDCNAALADADSRKSRQDAMIASSRPQMRQQAQAALIPILTARVSARICLQDYQRADDDLAAITSLSGPGLREWAEAMLGRVAIAQIRADTARATSLRRQLMDGIGLAGQARASALQQYGDEDKIVESDDNVELYGFVQMTEVARGYGSAGLTWLASRVVTYSRKERTDLAKRSVAILLRFAASAGDVECEALVPLGRAFLIAGQPAAAVDALRRALTKGRQYMSRTAGNGEPRDFRCGNYAHSGWYIPEADVVAFLIGSLVMAGDASGAVDVAKEWKSIDDDHFTAVMLARAHEATGQDDLSLAAWRNAKAQGAGRYGFEGSTHDVVAAGLLRLGAYGEAGQTWQELARLIEQQTESDYWEEAAPDVALARIYVDLATRLEANNFSDPLGCPSGRVSFTQIAFGRPTVQEASIAGDRAYYEYCEGWAEASRAAAPALAEQVNRLLLDAARRNGWDENEIRRLIEASLEAAWMAAGVERN